MRLLLRRPKECAFEIKARQDHFGAPTDIIGIAPAYARARQHHIRKDRDRLSSQSLVLLFCIAIPSQPLSKITMSDFISAVSDLFRDPCGEEQIRMQLQAEAAEAAERERQLRAEQEQLRQQLRVAEERMKIIEEELSMGGMQVTDESNNDRSSFLEGCLCVPAVF